MSECNRILIQRLASQGDSEALSAIMGQYAGMVYGTCRRVLGDNAQAADVAQETFFQLLKNAHRVTGSLGSWLHRVATRRAIDVIRQNAARRRREETYAASAGLEVDQWEEIEPLVDEALEELPDGLREVLVLHFLNGQSLTQIALAQGLSQPTVSRRLATGLEQLRYNLRARDVTVGSTILGGMLANSAQAAPAPLLHSLGKMVLAHAASSNTVMAGSTAATVVAAGIKAVLAAAAITVVAGIGWYLWHRNMPAPPQAIASTANPTAGAVNAPPFAAVPRPDNPTATVGVQPPKPLAEAPTQPMAPANGPIVDPGTYMARPGGSPTRSSGARSQPDGKSVSSGSAGGFPAGSGGSVQSGSRAVAPDFPTGMPRSGFGVQEQGPLPPPAQWGGQLSIGGGVGPGGRPFLNQGGAVELIPMFTTNFTFNQSVAFTNRRSWSTPPVSSGSGRVNGARGR
jgi:RNA polymerase sigma factor (sigma-70 family)